MKAACHTKRHAWQRQHFPMWVLKVSNLLQTLGLCVNFIVLGKGHSIGVWHLAVFSQDDQDAQSSKTQSCKFVGGTSQLLFHHLRVASMDESHPSRPQWWLGIIFLKFLSWELHHRSKGLQGTLQKQLDSHQPCQHAVFTLGCPSRPVIVTVLGHHFHHFLPSNDKPNLWKRCEPNWADQVPGWLRPTISSFATSTSEHHRRPHRDT